MIQINSRSAKPLLLLCLALAGLTDALAQTRPQPRLPVAELTAGMHVIRAELAVTPAQQATGMMWRTEMQGNEGMLFVNEDDQVRCFWMKNTLIPLTIAYLTADGTIINLADMQPKLSFQWVWDGAGSFQKFID